MPVKAALVLLIALLTAAAAAQQSEEPPRIGAIYGVVVGRDGQPAPNLRLTALPLELILSGILPTTKTDSEGKYRFEKLQLAKYTVYASDEDAGYPASYGTFHFGDTPLRAVKLTTEHPEAEFRVDLPPKAGFLQIHLTNRNTGAEIKNMRVKMVWAGYPNRRLESSSSSSQVLLLPPDREILLHVSSDGFNAWDQSIHLHSEERVTLDVQLEPAGE